jgi:hypothetical protein
MTLAAFSAAFVGTPDAHAKVLVVEKSANLGVIKGVVRDEAGNTIADAYVSIFRVGTSTLLKQVRSASDGSFLAKIMPELIRCWRSRRVLTPSLFHRSKSTARRNWFTDLSWSVRAVETLCRKKS